MASLLEKSVIASSVVSFSLLFEQIKEFKPKIIIFGGTYKFFQEDFGSCSAISQNDTLYIKAHHPMYTIKEEIYFNDILRAVSYNKSKKQINRS